VSVAEEAFLELVERAGGIAPRQAREAVRATLCTLAERITRGEAEDLAVFVPPEYRALLTSAGEPPERFGVDEFVRRVARREGLDSRTATRHVRAVFTALGQAASRDALSNLAAQLSTDFDPLLEAARRAGAVAPEQARAGAAQEDEPQPASPRTRATTAPHHWVFGAYQAVDRTLQRLFEVDARLLYGFVVPVLAISGLVVLLAADPTNWLLGLAVVLLLVASLIVVLGVVRMLGEDDATADRGSSPSG
jgi:uncharacterized protein (DUF2267 family)